jgi:hypothetical protein
MQWMRLLKPIKRSPMLRLWQNIFLGCRGEPMCSPHLNLMALEHSLDGEAEVHLI